MVCCNRVGGVNTTVVDSTWSYIKLYGSSFVKLAIKNLIDILYLIKKLRSVVKVYWVSLCAV